MAADEQLVGHALVSAEEAKRAVSVLEAKQGGTDHLLQALQAQVTQLANRVEASEEAHRAERARGEERRHEPVLAHNGHAVRRVFLSLVKLEQLLLLLHPHLAVKQTLLVQALEIRELGLQVV